VEMKTNLIIPDQYQSPLDLRETEQAIRLIKEFFQVNLSFELNLMRVTAPLFVKAGTGINDDLNGIERPVSFGIKAMDGMGRDSAIPCQVETNDAGRLWFTKR
jgi:aspartate--ammonia ligase